MSARLMQCGTPHLKPQLCAVDRCVIQLERGLVAWFLGQLAE